MHRIIPDLIIENHRAGRRQGSFAAVGMIIDLASFSTITDVLMQDREHGAEQMTALMYSVFEPLVKGILEYGGRILGFAGDGITAVFPAENNMEPAARNALAAAWSIQRKLGDVASLRTPSGAFPVLAKIGLACGDVSWGILQARDGGKATYYFRGNALDGARMAEHHAKAGDIILAENASECLSELAQSESAEGYSTVTGLRMTLPQALPVAEQPVDMEVARLFAADAILEEGLRGEFRQVVNLFLRVPNVADESLQGFIETLFDLRERYGGLVSHMEFGDKGGSMLMLWGAPTTYENDISRALNFILELRSRLDFQIAAGITFHLAHAGYVGSALFEDYTCYGWGVNLAARFMRGAGDGAIWVDERIVQRASNAFEVEYVGEQNFKGFARKQKVYRLNGWREEASSFYAGALAGREEELQRLAGAVQPLWRGEYAGITAITGEAGIGKSRLVHEFRTSGEASGRRVLWAVCASDQTLRQSLNPFRYWLWRYFNFSTAADERARLRNLHAKMDQLIAAISDEGLSDDLRRGRPFLAALVDVHWADSPYESMDAQSRYDNTLLALVALIKAESVRQPLILLIEDAHYLDPDSKVFLARLKRTLMADSSHPIAIILTARRQGTEVLVEEGFEDRSIDLGGLSPEAMVSLSTDVLGRPAAPELIRFLSERAEGNPFFAEQILHYMWDESLLEQDSSGNWQVQPGWQAAVLPADITTMLIARLDQLTRKVKEVVQTASVLGREFEIRALALMLKDDTTLDDEVAEATRAAIWTPLNELRCIFRHALLRDTAYSMQLLEHRRALHALALEALERLYSDDLAAHCAELAYHSEQAAHTEKAQVYLCKAADSARDAYQNADAIDYYTRALGLVPADDRRQRFNLLSERALLYARAGDRVSEATDLDVLEMLAAELDDASRKARVSMLRARHLMNTGNLQEAVVRARQAAEGAQGTGDIDVMLGARLNLPPALLRQGKFDEAMHEAGDTLLLAQQYGRSAEEGAALNLMGLIALEQKESATARGFLEQALVIARACSDRALEAKALNNLGKAAGEIERDYQSAREYYEQTYAIVRERGDRPAQAIVLGNLGWAAAAQGDLVSARSYQDKALSIARETGDPHQEAYTLINLSATAGAQGEAASALDLAVEAEALATQIGDPSARAWALLYKGHAHLGRRDLRRAQEAFEVSAGIRNELQQPGLATEPVAGLVQVALERRDVRAALQWTEKIMAHLEAGGTLDGTEEPLRIYLTCYRALEAGGDPRSKTVLRVARKMLDVQLSKVRGEEARRMYLENVPWRLALQREWETTSKG